jgi:hypothetical protein
VRSLKVIRRHKYAHRRVAEAAEMT